MHTLRRRRIHPAAPVAPKEVVIYEAGKRLTGRLMGNAFVWTEEVLTQEEWQAWEAANETEMKAPTAPKAGTGGRATGRK